MRSGWYMTGRFGAVSLTTVALITVAGAIAVIGVWLLIVVGALITLAIIAGAVAAAGRGGGDHQ